MESHLHKRTEKAYAEQFLILPVMTNLRGEKEVEVASCLLKNIRRLGIEPLGREMACKALEKDG